MDKNNKQQATSKTADIKLKINNEKGITSIKGTKSIKGKKLNKDEELKTEDEGIKTSKKSTKEPETMEELLVEADYKIRGYKKGDTVEGVVAAVSPKEILIDVGGKTEGIVADKEMASYKDLLMEMEVGQKVSCVVLVSENDLGQTVLSVRRAGFDIKWKRMEEKLENKEPVEVSGIEINKGGVIASCEGLRGFLPTSQLGPARMGKSADLINRKLTVIIIEVNKAQNRLIFSERAYTGNKAPVDKTELLKNISIREVYEGKVTGVVPYGLFVNIKGFDGLVHISEIAWEKVNNPADYFKNGDKIKVMVIGVEEASGKLNLSAKQLMPDPFKEAAKNFSKNMKVRGKISRLSVFGAFVTLENGVEGLIHISKVPPGKEFKAGEEVECTIESIDIERRRISLSPVLYEKPVGYK